ncbi:MAG TPA: GAF domain-containing protein, partial [Pyrinomonadaceae bacterium]|nr:GAF domain-containing protein [Pyrinomonadaceae bacterium]
MHRQYRSLLSASEAIATERDLTSLFKNLAEHLRAVAEFDAVTTVLYDPAHDLMRVQMAEPKLLENAPMPIELPVDASASGWVWKTQRPLIITDTEQEERFPELIKFARRGGLRSCCLLPLIAVGRWLGVLGFGSAKVSSYNQGDLEFLQQVANQVAVAIDNALKFEDARAAEQEVRLL